MPNSKAPGAEAWVPSDRSLSALRAAAQSCRGCALYRDATQAVMGVGSTDAALMVVGEQPGDQEDQQGEPFVGPAGQLLDKALTAAGITPASVFRTNVVKHFRWEGRGKRRIHKAPTRSQVTACAPWFAAELTLVHPTGVVLLGASAGKAVYGSSFRVGESRGRIQAWPADDSIELAARPEWALATTHPSAVLRSQNRTEDFDLLVTDLKAAAAALRA